MEKQQDPINIDKPDFYCDEVLAGKVDIEIVEEPHYTLAYKHTQPFWQHHVVIIPKKHIRSFNTIDMKIDGQYIQDLFDVVQKVSQQFELHYGGCQVNTNTGYLQSNRHLHIHVVAGERLRE